MQAEALQMDALNKPYEWLVSEGHGFYNKDNKVELFSTIDISRKQPVESAARGFASACKELGLMKATGIQMGKAQSIHASNRSFTNGDSASTSASTISRSSSSTEQSVSA